MKQILQSLKNGSTEIMDIPMPQIKAGHVLIQTSRTLISPGTEKMLLAFGEANLLAKARQQPDKVRMVLSKIKTDGLLTTLAAVRDKLDQLIPMGYSNVGRVIGVAEDVAGFALGDRVVSNGPHAEIVSVPHNLCCKIPASVSDDNAVFAILGAIALQGIRLAQPLLGETFAVIGLGLIGLLTVQLLRAQGVRVLGIDVDENKIALAQQFGASTINLTTNGNDVISVAQQFTRGYGLDGTIITCATDSNQPIEQAAQMCRKRGRITLVGVCGLKLSRTQFYEKELRFQVSCAYGPGRYDYQYEKEGLDYPIAFVRFTAKRNFEAFLDLLSENKLKLDTLISQRFPIEQAELAYALLSQGEKVCGLILEYPVQCNQSRIVETVLKTKATLQGMHDTVNIGFIGAGNYAMRTLIPAFKKSTANLALIACENGASGAIAAKRFHFETVTTDPHLLFEKKEINAVVIATRHNTHADFILRGLSSDKNIFIEKPLCMTLQELAQIEQAALNSPQLLMVGFNRRFAPHIQKIKSLLRERAQPKSFIITVNAGHIPKSHWTQDPGIGGGRILGEACHFIDLLRYLVGNPITCFETSVMTDTLDSRDTVTISLSFADGSIGTIHYFANGHVSFAKERLEIFSGGAILQLDNFRRLQGFGWPGFKHMNLWRQNKGQAECASQFVNAVQYGLKAPIALDEIIEVARVTIEIAQNVR